ncbi:MAG: DUF4956 domain-containing protein [Aridibacter famidurans]|nr:DUF4956 domain-containing protein [Aridibacter famidurans]
MKADKLINSLYGIGLAVLIGFASLHFVFEIQKGPGTQSQLSGPEAQAQKVEGDLSFFESIFETDIDDPNASWAERVLKIIAHLVVAFLLASLLAFRPRKSSVAHRSLHVAETQILLAVVAAALMMIVGDSAARAFAIFAAASLVRFRTNIRDPKEITVLLVSLALGLAAGVGRWDLGIVVCVLVIIMLWFLEQAEPELDLRSLELTLKTKDPEATRKATEAVFSKTGIESEFLELKGTEDPEKAATLVYLVNLRLSITTDRLTRMILLKGGTDIESVAWKTAKSTTKDIFE